MACCSLLLPILPAKYPALNNYPELKSDKNTTGNLLGISSSSDLNNTRRERNRSNLKFCCKSQLADLAPATSAAYGAILLGGGLFAFNKSGSKGSLFGGLTGAALMGTAYFLMQAPDTKVIGDALGFGSAFLFSAVFGIRLAATRKLVPSGLLLFLSLSTLAVLISAYLQDNV